MVSTTLVQPQWTNDSIRLFPNSDSLEEAELHDAWFRAEVEASLADPEPSIPNDQVFAEMDALVAAKRKARNAR
ncbi:antitoxin [Caballeronia sp. ATUFL_F1_KS4A]|uniref:type II toxin-antitoxin system RelB family antitoxin n=1 Tax=Caballeronia sp. ATUFL_F1_KS4A TaxID=2921768 RepID=UPI002027E461|nr:antitoxin [Caballeronia sp. ATUFL_F1_KS4A]